MASLEKEMKAREAAIAALEEEKRAKEETMATLAEEKQHIEKFASTMELKSLKDEAQSALHAESKELRQLSEERARLQEDDTLQQEAQEVTGKLEDMENEVSHI